MLYHIFAFLQSSYSWLNVFHYTSFRAMAALLTAIVSSLLLGSWFIGKAQQIFRSQGREWTPKQEEKNNMPSMGGVLIVAVVTITALLWCDLSDIKVWIALLSLIGFACIGAWDDWCKIVYKKGISARLKSNLQLGMAALVVGLWWYCGAISTQVYLPVFKECVINLGIFFIPWALFVIIGTSNAVNLTDGLDGLAIGSLITNFMTFALICYCAGHTVIAHYLHIPFVGTAELSVFAGALCGASLGFLWFNSYPAQIIMGDVGALGLGAVLGFMALACKQEMLLAISGGLFVVETLSVIMQVWSFKLLGKRIFKMAPLHHHFELLGWPESKITIRFCIISSVLALIALMLLKIR